MPKTSKVLVIGLNPAWQQVLDVPEFRPGTVVRARAATAFASGKGFNAAKVLARLGHEVSLLQVVAGSAGDRVLDACAARGIRSLHVRAPGDTRACITILGAGSEASTTEVIAPFSVPPDTATALLARLRFAGPFDAVLVCGRAPSGLPGGLHADLALLGAEAGASLCIWDSVEGLEGGEAHEDPRMSGAAALMRAFPACWLKVNAAEYRALEPALAATGARPALLVTDGPAPARVRAGDAEWDCALPALEDVVNPIGAGDTAAAVLADGLLRGLAPRAAVSAALSAAAASCLHPGIAEWDAAAADRIAGALRWTSRADEVSTPPCAAAGPDEHTDSSAGAGR